MHRSTTIVTDLGYGDAGKGSIVDYLARPKMPGWWSGSMVAARRLTTWSRPTAAAHLQPVWQRHFLPKVRTHLSRFMLINPLGLTQEADMLHALGVADLYARRLTIDRGADHHPVPPGRQPAARAARGADRHGSCGHGIGETMADAIDAPADAFLAGDLITGAPHCTNLSSPAMRKLAQLMTSEQLAGNPAAARDIRPSRTPTFAEVAEFYRQFAARRHR